VDFDVSRSRLTGKWRSPDGKKADFIDLQLIARRTERDKDRPEACGSDAFHEKLEHAFDRIQPFSPQPFSTFSHVGKGWGIFLRFCLSFCHC
jgi:hypothetical protein